MSNPMTTIKTRTVKETEIIVDGAAMNGLRITISPSLGIDDYSPDGVERFGCEVSLWGPDYDVKDEGRRVVIKRFLGEDELRAYGKAMLLAAGKLRRMESDARRRKQKREAKP